jgi:hypothetical protein
MRTILRVASLIACLAAAAAAQSRNAPCTVSGTSVTTPVIKKNSAITCDGSANAPTVSIAASSTANVTGYTNPAILELTSSATTIALTPSIAAFDSSRTPWVQTTLTIRANRTWKVLVKSTASTWTATGTFVWQAKPVGDLQWRLSTGSSWTSLTTTDAQIAPASGSGSADGANSVTVYWSSRLAWTSDKPGSYSLPVTLTLTTP